MIPPPLSFREIWWPFANLDDSTRPIPRNLTKKQEIAVGARLIWKSMHAYATDIKPFAIATIRLQTFY